MNRPPTYTFDWRLKEHAHVVSLLVQERFQGKVWRLLRWLLVTFLALATVVTVASAFLGDFASALSLGPLVILVGGLALWFPRVTGLLRAWQVRRMDPAVGGPTSLALEESDLRIFTEPAEIKLRWNGLHKVRETSDFFMFYYGERIAYYLPKRVIADPGEIDSTRRLIQERLSPTVPFEGQSGK